MQNLKEIVKKLSYFDFYQKSYLRKVCAICFDEEEQSFDIVCKLSQCVIEFHRIHLAVDSKTNCLFHQFDIFLYMKWFGSFESAWFCLENCLSPFRFLWLMICLHPNQWPIDISAPEWVPQSIFIRRWINSSFLCNNKYNNIFIRKLISLLHLHSSALME